ncbi:MAG TPA: hypothetical protein VEO01_05630 [Pseudonocardiaceae bacterium]|nr:hypothetical protein [Pseudonocardiaceae bacterium]
MDIFDVRDRLIGDYKEFTSSFVDVRDPKVRDHVERLASLGHQWPDPWLSLNPNFASGGTVDHAVADGLLTRKRRASSASRRTPPTEVPSPCGFINTSETRSWRPRVGAATS